MSWNSRNNTILDNAQLRRLAPSIFAEQAYGEMSQKYLFIPTIQVVEKMRLEGFVPVAAAESRTRIEAKRGFTKHVIRFRDVRNGNDEPVLKHLGQIFTELVLTNAHDGGAAYMLDAGLMRLVCMNGMMVDAGKYSQMKVRHTGNSADGVIEASYSVAEEFPKVLDSVEQFAQKQLTDGQRRVFAETALTLRYDEKNPSPVTPDQILRPQRYDDRGNDLWRTFNTVQEHIVKGGARGTNPTTLRRAKVRTVNGISENARLNRALWALAEKMATLVA